MEFLQKPKLTRGSVLRFTAYSWAKLLYFRDIGPTEVGMYGLTETDDALLITDVCLVKQEATSCTLEFDKQDSIDFVEKMTDMGLSPFQCSNVFIHSHPGNCPNPSITDENNFNKNFSHPDWAIFFIIARGGSTYCRVRHNIGPGIEVTIGTAIDYSYPFPASDHKAWDEEYKEKVTESKSPFVMVGDGSSCLDWINNWQKDPERLYGKSQQTVGEILESIQEKEEMDENLQLFYDPREDVVWFWNEDEEDYWKYDPALNKFYDENDNHIFFKDIPKECKVGEIIKFGKENFNEEESFLNETQDVEPCIIED